MKIEYDPAKRAVTLEHRQLDFADAGRVFAGRVFTVEDVRFDYPERRFVTFGLLDARMVSIVWTEIDDGRRIISMRKANDKEQRRHRDRIGKDQGGQV
jgi:uncharacterized DUF497 family protein